MNAIRGSKDDVQLLENREDAQEELFYTFNAFHNVSEQQRGLKAPQEVVEFIASKISANA